MPDLNFAIKGNSRIFVLDDNPANVLFLEKLLTKAGYTDILTSTQPLEAEKITSEYRPDLVILDLHMPGMNGYEVLEMLRHRGAHDVYLPVLIFTADVTSEAKRRALELGATDFLTKPGDPSEITLRVRNFLEMRSLYKELEHQNELLEKRVLERTQRLQEAQLEIVQRLALAGDYRDDDTGEHCRRVADMSFGIAVEYGLSPSDADLIRLAAPLHDIGKVGISDTILRKAGRLTPEEFEEVKRHTMLGASILANSRCEILQLAHDIALSHHERWDGRGYGRRLAGEDIPIAGRIVAVADVYDALTSERPYKPAWPSEKAIEEIVRNSGSQFDPTVIEAFLRLMSKHQVQNAA